MDDPPDVSSERGADATTKLPSTPSISAKMLQKLADRNKKHYAPTPAISSDDPASSAAKDPAIEEIRLLEVNFQRDQNAYNQKVAANLVTPSVELEFLRKKRAYRLSIAKYRDDLRRETEAFDVADDDDIFLSPNGSLDNGKRQTTENSTGNLAKKIRGLPDTTASSDLLPGILNYVNNGSPEPSEPEPEPSGTRRAKGSKARGGRGSRSTVQNPTNGRAASAAVKRGGRVAKAPKPMKLTKKEIAQQRRQNNLFNPHALINPSLFRDMHNNAGPTRPNNFAFSVGRKNEALKELMASIPEEHRAVAKIDKNQLYAALSYFTPSGSVTAMPGTEEWKMVGMKSLLSHHQMLAVSFMRERESAEELPLGGLEGDQMGLGKTVMMIANIVNGMRPKQMQTTLIVATSSLVKQWEHECYKHVEPKKLGRIIRYHGSNKLTGDYVVDQLMEYNIIITTYDEVRGSCPKQEYPQGLTTPEEKAIWWREFYDETKGPLHRINFHRIVLDEAQAIKNCESQTSKACRALEGTYRWAMSGTPVLNRLEEFFPYFKFLQVPGIGELDDFKRCYTGNEDSHSRLNLLLRTVMIRRLGHDRLFNQVINPLPKATKRDHICHFSEIERAIYDTVRKRFIASINGFIRNNTVNKKYSHILTMILRLRQVAAHPLLVQDSLRDLLEPEDFAHLKSICDKAVPEHMEQKFVIAHLKMMLAHDPKTPLPVVEPLPPGIGKTEFSLGMHVISENESENCPNADEDEPRDHVPMQEDRENPDNNPGFVEELEETGLEPVPQVTLEVGGSFGKTNSFDKYVGELERHVNPVEHRPKEKCQRCHLPPTDPHKASCSHIFCYDCIRKLTHEAELGGEDAPTCTVCITPFHGTEEYVPSVRVKECPDETKAGLTLVSNAKGKSSTKRAEMKRVIDQWVNENGHMLPSAKTLAFKAQLLNWFQENPDEKIIIYSQFTSFIYILSKICTMEKWDYVTYTGDDNIEARSKKIEKFEKKGTNIMLMSLKTGGLGLNLTMASSVIMIDLWWNLGIEDQAFGRIHRRGQEKETRLTRFIVANSIDTEIVAMQRRKELEIGNVMDNESKNSKRFNIDEMLALFGPLITDNEGRRLIYDGK